MLTFNIGLLVFCYLEFSPANYVYGALEPERSWVLSDACEYLLRTHYVWWANSYNLFLVGVYWMLTQNAKAGGVLAAVAVIIYLCGLLVLRDAITEHYFTIFQYQKVPDELVSQPARKSAPQIAPLLRKELESPNRAHVKNAIRALGAIRDIQVMDTLNVVLNDWESPDDIRFEAYFALKQMEHSRADSYVRVFLAAHHPIRDRELMLNIKKYDY